LPGRPEAPRPRRAAQWLSWLLGGALLVAVVVGALQFSEERAFVRLAQQVRPWWLGLALLMQAGTYWAQGGIWRIVCRADGARLPMLAAVELGLAKLFADQALPSAGLSSSVLVAKALQQRHLPEPAVNAAVLVNIASYHLAYVVTLVAALGVLWRAGYQNALVLVVAALFLLFSIGLSAAVLVLSGAPHPRIAALLRPVPLRTVLRFLGDADVSLMRDGRVLAAAIGLQTIIVVCDAATIWILILAIGETASPSGVFAAFMIASLFRTVGIAPGGLGTFEASSVLMLRRVGVETAVALSATLLFRGLSFWLPMLPGYWASRRVLAPRTQGRGARR
jgi:Mg2+-importing ATPase